MKEKRPSSTVDITRAVIAEDEPEMRRLLALDLRLNGVDVTGVSNGAELVACIERLARSPEGLPDVVITDVRMPVMDGLTAVERIRAIAPELPVIVISGFVSTQTQNAARDLGARTLSKPFDFDHLISLLDDHRPN